MIELPESVAIAGQLERTVKGLTIADAVAGASPHKFAWYSKDPGRYGEMLAGKTVTACSAQTEYTCGGNIEIRCEEMLLILSTPVRYHAPGDKLPKTHQLMVEFTDGAHLTCTVQMWGGMLCFRSGENGIPEGWTMNTRAPSPLSEAFDEAYFMDLMRTCKPSISVKAALATEQRIPGLGNGVLQDILFNARLHPKHKLANLSEQQYHTLFTALKSTLAAMTAQGGRDTERDLFGVPGGYKTILSSKTLDKPCPVCSGSIERQAFLGGNIYFCPVCQV